MYGSPASPLPIMRSEQLTLIEAMIRLGLNDVPGAVTLINQVRTEVGGVAAVSPAGFVAVRDQILKELEISTIMEGGADRLMAIQLYNVATIADTTWTHVPPYNGDQHTVMFPITAEELQGRNGTWAPACP
jgi:hypothetical protein